MTLTLGNNAFHVNFYEIVKKLLRCFTLHIRSGFIALCERFKQIKISPETKSRCPPRSVSIKQTSIPLWNQLSELKSNYDGEKPYLRNVGFPRSRQSWNNLLQICSPHIIHMITAIDAL